MGSSSNDAKLGLPTHIPSAEQPLLYHRPLPENHRRKRLFKGLVFFAILLFVGFRTLAHHRMKFGFLRRGSDRFTDRGFSSVVQCAEWSESSHPSDDYHSESSTFELPVASDTLFFTSRGNLPNGVLHLSQSDEVSDVVKVNVTAYYKRRELLERVSVCQVKREQHENGISLFSEPHDHPHHGHHHRRDHLHFDVVVTLPKASRKSPLSIANFVTDMPLFAHHVGDLAATVSFDALLLKSALASINVKSLSADQAIIETSNGHIYGFVNTTSSLDVKTSNGPIEGSFSSRTSLTLITSNGHISATSASAETVLVRSANGFIEGSFNSSSSLTLKTANGYIKANVSLLNNEGSKPTSLELTTSNGPISSNVTLLSSAHSGKGGEFDVQAKTAIGGVTLNFPHAPVDSKLELVAHTALAPVDVKVHKSYEGGFSVSTSMARSAVTHERVRDPSGQGRERKVEFERQTPGSIQGSVSWGGKTKGFVDLSTTMSSAVLKL